jgi:hypothetical protein
VQQSAAGPENTRIALRQKFSTASCAMTAQNLNEPPKWSNIVHN